MNLSTVSSGGQQITIPSSLRGIQPFLDDALKFIKSARKGGPNSTRLFNDNNKDNIYYYFGCKL